jgi:multiple sugar transport system permease protein
MSLYDWNPLSPTHPFVGFDNYKEVYEQLGERRSATQMAFKNTGKYVLMGMPIQLLIGLMIALLLNEILKLQTVFRAVYFLPFVTSTVAISWVFRWLYSVPYGPLNVMIASFGLEPQKFLMNPKIALYSILAVSVWQGLGYCVIIFLAGLKQIPQTYYEAAQIDGSNRWQSFRHITIPLLNNSFVYLIVLQTISFLRMFGPIVNMTSNGEGGPLNSTTSVVLRIYREGFSSLDMGYASTLSVLLFLVILTITLIQLRVTQRDIS